MPEDVKENIKEAGIKSPEFSAVLVITDKGTGEVVNEIKFDQILKLEQNKSLQQYPVDGKPGRRVFLPGGTVTKFEGLKSMSAEELVEYVDSTLKSNLENILSDDLDGVDPGEVNIASISANKLFGRFNQSAFGMGKKEFEEKTEAFPAEPR